MTNNQFFYSLTPDRVLEAVERADLKTTGVCYALNSLENRVYEVELEDRSRVVGKFYRPGRWPDETILDEHRLLLALQKEEIPVCAPIVFGESPSTLHHTEEGIRFTLFPRTGGRSPDEILRDDYEQLGRLLARIHNISAAIDLKHRPTLSPQYYGRDNLELILERCQMPAGLAGRYRHAVERFIDIAEEEFKARLSGIKQFVTHADCHRANLLRGNDGFFFLDFDDSAIAPAVQDVWLLLPSRVKDCPSELESFLSGYEAFREFDPRQLGLIEVLRGLRYIRYAGWIASRMEDPAFKKAFPEFGSESYWEGQMLDILEQVELIERETNRVYH